MNALAMLLPMVGGVASGSLQKKSRLGGSLPWMTSAVVVVGSAILALQLRYPILLVQLARQPALIVYGQVWRAATALFVQDGGFAGGLFNTVLLLVIGPIAESRLGPKRWAIAYFGGGIVTEFLALAWQPYGAGNSIACFALAGALVITSVAQRRSGLLLVAALVGSVGALALLVMHDIHGIGFLAGSAIGVGFAQRDRRLDRTDATGANGS
jgi:membrane associated rhomboid family serine protease